MSQRLNPKYLILPNGYNLGKQESLCFQAILYNILHRLQSGNTSGSTGQSITQQNEWLGNTLISFLKDYFPIFQHYLGVMRNGLAFINGHKQ